MGYKHNYYFFYFIFDLSNEKLIIISINPDIIFSSPWDKHGLRLIIILQNNFVILTFFFLTIVLVSFLARNISEVYHVVVRLNCRTSRHWINTAPCFNLFHARKN